MLYLIKSGNYLKIGYSSNVNKRLESYRTCNPEFIVLDVIEGDEKLEKTLHKICKEFKVKGRLIPVPTSIFAGCGLAWCTDLNEEESIMNMLSKMNIQYQENHLLKVQQ